VSGIAGKDYLVGGSILGIITPRQTGHKKFAGRGGSSPGLLTWEKEPGRNFLHFWHHHSNVAIVRFSSGGSIQVRPVKA